MFELRRQTAPGPHLQFVTHRDSSLVKKIVKMRDQILDGLVKDRVKPYFSVKTRYYQQARVHRWAGGAGGLAKQGRRAEQGWTPQS